MSLLQDTARNIMSLLVSPERIALVDYEGGPWITDTYTIFCLGAVAGWELGRDVERGVEYKLTIGKGLVPTGSEREYTKTVTQYLDRVGGVERHEVRLTKWEYQGARLLDSKSPVWINARVAEAWSEIADLDVRFDHEGELKPVEILGRYGPKPSYLDRRGDTRKYETVGYIMPMEIDAFEDPVPSAFYEWLGLEVGA